MSIKEILDSVLIIPILFFVCGIALIFEYPNMYNGYVCAICSIIYFIIGYFILKRAKEPKIILKD